MRFSQIPKDGSKEVAGKTMFLGHHRNAALALVSRCSFVAGGGACSHRCGLLRAVALLDLLWLLASSSCAGFLRVLVALALLELL